MPRSMPDSARAIPMRIVLSFILLQLLLFSPTGIASGTGERDTNGTAVFLPDIAGLPGAPLPLEPGEPEEPTPIGDELTPGARLAAIEAIGETLETLLPPQEGSPLARDLEGELFQIAQALTEMPEILATIVHTETVTVHAILLDGLPIAIVNNRPPGIDDLEPPENAAVEVASPASQTTSDPVALPGTRRAVVANYDGGDSVRAEVATLLNRAGYEILPLGAGIEAMRNYRNLGVLYLDTHGASFLRVTGIRDGDAGRRSPIVAGSVYGLQTSTPVSLQTLEDEYLDDLRSGRIAVKFVETPLGWRAQIAVTELFIAHYWSFEDAIVVIHACFGGADTIEVKGTCSGSCPEEGPESQLNPRSLRQAMLNNGAQAVVSFDNLTNTGYARPSILYLFDRLLGHNEFRPVTPPNRPFPVGAVRNAMAQEGLLTFYKPDWVLGPFSIGGNQVNVTFDMGQLQVGLAPSIEWVDVFDDANLPAAELTIYGIFGEETDESAVELDGEMLQIQEWLPDEIIVESPFGATGELTVISPDGVRSNPVPITKWTGNFTYTLEGPGTLQVQTVLELVFRADVHAARADLQATPLAGPIRSYVSPESSGRTRGSGTHTLPGGSVTTWAGDSEMDVYSAFVVDSYAGEFFDTFAQSNLVSLEFVGDDDGNGETDELLGKLGGLITMDVDAQSARLCLVSEASYRVETDDDPLAEFVLHSLYMIIPTDLPDATRGLLVCIDLPIGDDYSLSADERTVETDEGKVRVEWSDFVPQHPPDSETPG